MASKTPIRSNTTPFSPSFFKSKSESKSVFLHDWWLVKPQCKGLAIGGVAFSMERERVFLSTVIAKRHEANVVESEDGIVIIFRGFINASRTSQNGFSSEVCSNFLLGFPHDWKNYLVHSGRDECDYLNGVNVSDDSNASAHKTIDETLPFSIPDNNEVVPPKEICNGGGSSCGKSSKQAESTGNMECAIDSMTIEAKDKDKDNMGNLKLSQPQVDVIYNGENGVPDVAFESPVSTEKLKNDQLSCDGKKKKRNRQKIVEDTGDSCSRVVTRSTSNRSCSKVKKDEKVKANSFGKSSEQSESTDNMECGIDTMTIEAEDKDNTGNLKLSRPQVDVIYNDENGVSDVVAVESPVSTEKLKNDQLSCDRMEERHVRQKIVEDTGDSYSGLMTRSTSNRSRTKLKKDEKAKDNSFGKNSKQFESTDNMECGIDMVTIEVPDKDNMGNLELSRPQVDVIYNGENGVSDVAVESLVSIEKLKNDQLSCDRKKKHIRQKIVEDTSGSCSGVVTRSTSNRSRTKLKKDEKAKDNSFGKNSKQFDSTDNMECGIGTMTIEAEDKNNMENLELSRPQVDMIYDGANGISDVAVESPVSTQKLKNNPLSSDCKEKKRIRQRIVEDTGDSSSRVVTGSTSKRRLTKVEKVKEACASGPVRRSPRLLKSKMTCL